MPADRELGEALLDFFTSEVRIGPAPKGLALRSLYWESRRGWEYPWRITAIRKGIAFGYPCGEPRKVKP
jgi:hypothetical protein